MYNRIILLVTLLFFVLSFGVKLVEGGGDEEIAGELTKLLKSSRAVLVQNKPLIKNPTGAGIDTKKFMAITYENYKKSTGNDFAVGSGDKGVAQSFLIKSIEGVVADVVSGKDTALDPKGRFLPAIFARKAAARFGELSNGTMYLKLTTRDKFLVNPCNKADDWERGVIEGTFLKADWKKGKTYSETAKHNGKKAFRLILPEYFKKGCMGCHGGDYGAKIHPGKVGGSVGELGGAISVAIYK